MCVPSRGFVIACQLDQISLAEYTTKIFFLQLHLLTLHQVIVLRGARLKPMHQ